MAIQVDHEVYLSKEEAKKLLGGVSDQTLRVLAKRHGVKRYNRDIAPNIKFYRKSDLEELIKFRPVEDKEDKEKE